jgi:DNA-3-methyladenine glycosylase I
MTAEPVSDGLWTAEDGTVRCAWCRSDPAYVAYHDTEWGVPTHDDRALFEKICLEGFQSGLSWLTILRKRENFRRAFDGFDIEKVAGYGEMDVARLLSDEGIVRNRKKIEAAIANARAARELHSAGETLDELLWSFAPDPKTRPAPKSGEDIPAATDESTALSKELKRRGFIFVGPTTVYATMQAVGLVNDHLAGCAFR